MLLAVERTLAQPSCMLFSLARIGVFLFVGLVDGWFFLPCVMSMTSFEVAFPGLVQAPEMSELLAVFLD